MTRLLAILLLITPALASAAPGDPGTRNAACYPNDTCNKGLSCVAGTCKGGEGDDGQACYGNDTCNKGLTCIAGTCKVAQGGDGQACYGNDTCNKGLTCVAKKCIVEAPECRAPAKGMYDACVTKAKAGWQGFSESFALEKARSFCTGAQDLDVLDLALTYYSGFDGPFAMEKSLEFAKLPGLRAKIAILSYAAGEYVRSFDKKPAFDLAAKNTQTVSSDAVTCLRDTAKSFSHFNNPKFAMDEAFKACAPKHPPARCAK